MEQFLGGNSDREPGQLSFQVEGSQRAFKTSRKTIGKLGKHVGGASCSVPQVALVFGEAKK